MHFDNERDVALLQMKFAKLNDSPDNIVEIERAPIGCASAHERQEIADDLPGARRFAPYDFQIALHGGRVALLHHQLDRTDNRLQRVIDLVRDTSDELADR